MKKTPLFAVILITSLFFLWGFALNLNPILIPHLKKACLLTDTQSAFIDSASYIAYFIMAIPAGLFIKRFGYKGGIVLGLFLFAVGSFLFYPAAETRMYIFFLGALFIIASGLTFLETAANPYITVLGDPKTAVTRINFAQSFNGLGAFLAPRIGGAFILSGVILSDEAQYAMTPADLETYLHNEAISVQGPFLAIGGIVLLVALLLLPTKLPEIKEEASSTDSFSSFLKEKNFIIGVVAQFFYVGAQVCVSSFFIRYSQQVGGLHEKSAAELLSWALLAFMAGRFIGTFLMKYIAPAKLLLVYSAANFFLLFFSVFTEGIWSVYALFGVEFFMSIMFPTIFALSIFGLGSKTKKGSSLIIMSIVGGAIFPVIMGKVSDIVNIQVAYSVPAICFLFIIYFAFKNISVGSIRPVVSH